MSTLHHSTEDLPEPMELPPYDSTPEDDFEEHPEVEEFNQLFVLTQFDHKFATAH